MLKVLFKLAIDLDFLSSFLHFFDRSPFGSIAGEAFLEFSLPPRFGLRVSILSFLESLWNSQEKNFIIGRTIHVPTI